MLTRLFLILVLLTLVITSPAVHANDRLITVYAESGRYSLEIPSDWVVADVPAAIQPHPQFTGESFVVADSESAIQSWVDGQTIGQIIFVDVNPVAHLRLWGEPIEDKTDEELLQRRIGFGESTDAEVFAINGQPAARQQYTRHGFTFAGAEQSGVTIVMAGGLFYTMAYTGPDLAALEAIADTLTVYDPAADSITRRPMFAPSSGIVQLPAEPGWLLMDWYWFTSPFQNSQMFTPTSTTTSHYYLMLADAQAETLDLLFRWASRPGGDEVDLPGFFVMIGVHPYDSLFGTADVTVSDDDRQTVFDRILVDLGATAADEAEDVPRQIDYQGMPAFVADLERVFNTDDNQGRLIVIDTGSNFYAVTFAASNDRWQDGGLELAQSLEAGMVVTPPTGDIMIGLQVGQQAPDFTLTLLDERVVSLSDYRGKIVVLNFWATWCQPCTEKMPYFQEVTESRDDAVILAVDFAEPHETVAAFAEENGLTFPIALDTDGAVNRLYNIRAYPTTYILDTEGIIHSIPFAEGQVNAATINRWIDRVE